MMGHKIGFYGEMWLIIPQLSILPLLPGALLRNKTLFSSQGKVTYFRHEFLEAVNDCWSHIVLTYCSGLFMKSSVSRHLMRTLRKL